MKTAFAVAASLAVATNGQSLGSADTTTPAYLSVPNFASCLEMQTEGSTMETWCLPATQPDSSLCPASSWSQLADSGLLPCSLDDDKDMMTQYREKFAAFAKTHQAEIQQFFADNKDQINTVKAQIEDGVRNGSFDFENFKPAIEKMIGQHQSVIDVVAAKIKTKQAQTTLRGYLEKAITAMTGAVDDATDATADATADATVTDFASCVAAGHPVEESYPAQCHDPVSDQTFTEENMEKGTEDDTGAAANAADDVPVTTDFASCVAAGHPVDESYPAQCRDPVSGQTFTEENMEKGTEDATQDSTSRSLESQSESQSDYATDVAADSGADSDSALDTLQQQLMLLVPKLQQWAVMHSAQVLPYAQPVQQLVNAFQSGDPSAVQAYMSDPARQEQLEELKQLVVGGLVAHKAKIAGFVAAHRAELVAALGELRQKVESGKLGGGAFDCDLTDADCVEKLNLGGAHAEQVRSYLTDPANKAELQAKMAEFKQKRDAFFTTHKDTIIAVIDALTSALETGSFSGLLQIAALVQQQGAPYIKQVQEQAPVRHLRGGGRRLRGATL